MKSLFLIQTFIKLNLFSWQDSQTLTRIKLLRVLLKKTDICHIRSNKKKKVSLFSYLSTNEKF